jgi:hypothetical protein
VIVSDHPVSVFVEGGQVIVSVDDLATVTTQNLPDRQAPEPGVTDESKKAHEPVNREGRCNVLMPRAGELCYRVPGHNGAHMPYAQVAKKRAYNKAEAKNRYQNDPEYAERVKAAVRGSAAQKRQSEGDGA